MISLLGASAGRGSGWLLGVGEGGNPSPSLVCAEHRTAERRPSNSSVDRRVGDVTGRLLSPVAAPGVANGTVETSGVLGKSAGLTVPTLAGSTVPPARDAQAANNVAPAHPARETARRASVGADPSGGH